MISVTTSCMISYTCHSSHDLWCYNLMISWAYDITRNGHFMWYISYHVHPFSCMISCTCLLWYNRLMNQVMMSQPYDIMGHFVWYPASYHHTPAIMISWFMIYDIIGHFMTFIMIVIIGWHLCHIWFLIYVPSMSLHLIYDVINLRYHTPADYDIKRHFARKKYAFSLCQTLCLFTANDKVLTAVLHIF
jgi:hypothetical protein